MQKIRDILHHDDYKNITGLHSALDDYLTLQEQQADEEDARLKLEEAEVIAEEDILNTHPCDCIWSEWQEWDSCTVSCGGGSKKRQRTVLRNATNNGKPCEGGVWNTSTCNLDPCREKIDL